MYRVSNGAVMKRYMYEPTEQLEDSMLSRKLGMLWILKISNSSIQFSLEGANRVYVYNEIYRKGASQGSNQASSRGRM